jgi:hypothetical protein
MLVVSSEGEACICYNRKTDECRNEEVCDFLQEIEDISRSLNDESVFDPKRINLSSAQSGRAESKPAYSPDIYLGTIGLIHLSKHFPIHLPDNSGPNVTRSDCDLTPIPSP